MGRYWTRTRWAASVAAATLALAACGGGGHDDRDDVTERVPGSASESVDGFIDYLMKLVVASADDLEPIDVSGVTPPTDETTEPRQLE